MTTETLTERMILTPIDPKNEDEIAALFAIQSDPETWIHLPEGRETRISQTRTVASQHCTSWEEFGLGWWTVRLRENLGDVEVATIIGLGGCGIRNPELRAWNLGYRLIPAVWGHGLATELSRAAVDASQEAQSDIPITARVLTHNTASWRVLERVGLTPVWEGTAETLLYPLTSQMHRRVYADRPIPERIVNQLIALG